MAAYVPAYKILNFRNANEIDVQTIVIEDVPRFDELFEHYQQEWDHLKILIRRIFGIKIS